RRCTSSASPEYRPPAARDRQATRRTASCSAPHRNPCSTHGRAEPEPPPPPSASENRRALSGGPYRQHLAAEPAPPTRQPTCAHPCRHGSAYECDPASARNPTNTRPTCNTLHHVGTSYKVPARPRGVAAPPGPTPVYTQTLPGWTMVVNGRKL